MFLFGSAILFGLADNFIIEFADDGRSIDVEVGGVFYFGEDGSVVIFAFVLHEDAFIDHQFVHFLFPILFVKLYIIIEACMNSILIIFQQIYCELWTATRGPHLRSLFLTLTWM